MGEAEASPSSLFQKRRHGHYAISSDDDDDDDGDQTPRKPQQAKAKAKASSSSSSFECWLRLPHRKIRTPKDCGEKKRPGPTPPTIH